MGRAPGADCSAACSNAAPRRPHRARLWAAGAAVAGAAAMSNTYTASGFVAPTPATGLASPAISAASQQLSRGAVSQVGPSSAAKRTLGVAHTTVQPLVLAAGLLTWGRRHKRRSVARAADGGEIEELVPFELRGFSLAQLVLAVGFFLILIGVLDFSISGSTGGSGISSLFLIYSVPALTLGAALVYAELQPVTVDTEPDAEGLFDEKATDTLKGIKSDVTRHRYGDDAHLDSSLKALNLVVQGRYPQLKRIIESKAPSGELEFTMLFESKDVPYTTWADPMKTVAFDRFFGPGVWSEVYKYSSEKKIAALKLTTGARPADKALAKPGAAAQQAAAEAAEAAKK
mmetsp:Transcript_13493/g.29611  ORF Transcript_13493/g.29611 Transcript_13493/m.29611 type:complete len:345 (-) Transcript_13493:97-1131(-)